MCWLSLCITIWVSHITTYPGGPLECQGGIRLVQIFKKIEFKFVDNSLFYFNAWKFIVTPPPVPGVFITNNTVGPNHQLVSGCFLQGKEGSTWEESKISKLNQKSVKLLDETYICVIQFKFSSIQFKSLIP